MVGLALLLVILAVEYSPRDAERERVRERYQQMRVAVSVGDTNSAAHLLSEDFRRDAPSVASSLSMFARFAKPLTWRSSIKLSDRRATICPERIFLSLRWPPTGNRITMVKTNGEWYFTGDIHID